MPANYTHVNGAWPDDCPVPTPQEALAGARRLVRLALTLGPINGSRKRFGGGFVLTSGTRRCWTRRGVFYVNPDNPRYSGFRGWRGIVHDISHWAGRRLYPDAKPHDARVAFIERMLAEHVVNSGWLAGKLKRSDKPKPTKDDIRRQRYAATVAAIERWQRKERRAKNALRKLALRRKYYERELAPPG
jgi:hypothetical protein